MTYEDAIAPAFGNKVRLWPDSCQLHSHQRGKLQMKPMHKQTLNRFAAGELQDAGSVLEQAAVMSESFIREKSIRVVGHPPETSPELVDIRVVLFDIDERLP